MLPFTTFAYNYSNISSSGLSIKKFIHPSQTPVTFEHSWFLNITSVRFSLAFYYMYVCLMKQRKRTAASCVELLIYISFSSCCLHCLLLMLVLLLAYCFPTLSDYQLCSLHYCHGLSPHLQLHDRTSTLGLVSWGPSADRHKKKVQVDVLSVADVRSQAYQQLWTYILSYLNVLQSSISVATDSSLQQD